VTTPRAEVAPLLRSLAGLLDVDRHAVPVHGPRVWWAGPLNVETLAIESVRCALSAARARGLGSATEVTSELVAANFASVSHLRVDGRAPRMFAPMSGYFRCADGWIRTHANYPHHEAALCRALGVTDAASLTAALAELPAAPTEAAIRAAGGVAAALRSREEWISGPQGRAVAEQPWIRLRPGEHERQVAPRRLRVLDFTRVIAGPTASKFLASLGADVLRIDPPRMPELQDQHLDTGAGKRSAEADLTEAVKLEQVRELAASADVVMLGYRPRALARFGLDPDDLHAAHPHLSVVHLDAWGAGPWARDRGFDSIVQAASGVGDAYRMPDGAPGVLPVQALDHATGYGAAAAALALLECGGIAHLSLARTAHELFELPAPVGASRELDAPVVEIESPYGRLRQVRPLVGEPRAPGEYGSAALAWA
jgi:crotonobetainyl-CoA:carnitine CoA-transferase CaiB-like acyl-CoA transferase